jgi:hypothetical protein
MSELRQIDFEQARRIAAQKGLMPGRVKGTNAIRFTRGSHERLETIDWQTFEEIAQQRGLVVYESGGWMKLMRKK